MLFFRRFCVGVLCFWATVVAAEIKIGFVSTDVVLRESAPAKFAQSRLEKEFKGRTSSLAKIEKQLKSMQESLEKNVLTMSDGERRDLDRKYNDLLREYQRSQREAKEELNARRNEEYRQIIDLANEAIKKIARAHDFDLILQEAVYVSNRLDITSLVIAALEGEQ